MKKHLALPLLICALALMMPLGIISAKGTPDRAVLLGPDWFGELEIIDPQLLQALAPGIFEDLDNPAESIADLPRGYLLTRGYIDDGTFTPWDRVIYFADPSGGRGLVYYLEIVNGSGPYDGKWFHVSELGEAAIMEIFEEQRVRPPEIDQANPPSSTNAWMIGVGLLILGLGSVSGYALGRKQKQGETSLR